MRTDRTLAPLRIEPRPSRRLLAALVAAHTAAALAVLVAVSQPLVCALLLALLLASAVQSVREHGSRGTTLFACELQLTGERDCRILRGGTQSVLCRVEDSSYVSPWLVVLHLRMPGRLRLQHVVLLPDSLDADAFRRLRARLRWSQSSADRPSGEEASL